MNIAIDISPITKKNLLQHRVRGTGFYIENLKSSLLRYFPENRYIFFTSGDKLPKDIDLVHYPYFEPFFLSLPIFGKFKTVVTVHDLIPLVFPEHFRVGLRGNLKWQIQKLALRNTSRIITDSESSKRDIIKFTGIARDKISVAYLAASHVFKTEANTLLLRRIRVKYKLLERFILYVGDATWNKNLPILIKAIKKIKVPLVMAGQALVEKDFDKSNPWNQDLLEAQRLVENDNKIIRLGFVSQDDLVMLYNIATVFVMPSLYEGFGLPILEAMSCGCPVVTSKEGSIPEVAGDSAFYINAYDSDNIAKGIKAIYEDKDLQKRYSAKGLIQAKKFSWKKTVQETVKVYESITK